MIGIINSFFPFGTCLLLGQYLYVLSLVVFSISILACPWLHKVTRRNGRMKLCDASREGWQPWLVWPTEIGPSALQPQQPPPAYGVTVLISGSTTRIPTTIRKIFRDELELSAMAGYLEESPATIAEPREGPIEPSHYTALTRIGDFFAHMTAIMGVLFRVLLPNLVYFVLLLFFSSIGTSCGQSEGESSSDDGGLAAVGLGAAAITAAGAAAAVIAPIFRGTGRLGGRGGVARRNSVPTREGPGRGRRAACARADTAQPPRAARVRQRTGYDTTVSKCLCSSPC